MNTQLSLFGKMSPEPSAVTTAETSPVLSLAWLEQRYIVPKQDGQAQVLLLDQNLKWLGECSTLNIGESPSVAVESSLSQILEVNVPEKYFLSSKACKGILRRAEKRGKKLPPVLELALRQQCLTHTTIKHPENLQRLEQIAECQPEEQFYLNHEAKMEYQESTIKEFVQLSTPCGGQRQPCIVTYLCNQNSPTIAFNGRQDPVSGNITGALDTCSPQAQCVVTGYRKMAHGEYAEDCSAGTIKACDYKNATNLAVSVDVRNLYETPELSGTLQAKNTGGYSLNYQNPIRIGYRVRRLIPLECERLMGFVDGWTAGGSDTARYKAIGNSIAVPCLAWIFSQLVRVVQKYGGQIS